LAADSPVRLFDDAEGTSAVDLDRILEAGVLDSALGGVELVSARMYRYSDETG
jgi:hypothetical protein